MKFAVAAAAVAGAVATAASAQPVQLKFADPIPPTGFLHTRAFVPWAEEVNKAAEGAIEVKLFPGPALATLGNVYDRTINGVVEIGWGNFAPITTQIPKTNVVTLPFETRTVGEGAQALWRLYTRGLIADEWGKVRLLALTTFGGANLHSRKPVKTMADLRGLKVSAEGRVVTRALENLGATPVHMSVTELYSSLTRATIDAVVIGWPAVPAFKLLEVTNHHVDAPLGTDAGYVIMNKEAYSRLPERARAVIDRAAGDALTDRLMRVNEGAVATARRLTQAAAGHDMGALAPDEEARWAQRVAPVIDEWVAATRDGAKVLAAFRDEVKKIREGEKR